VSEWSAADDQVVRDGVAAGQSYEQIATALGRTPTAVQVRMFSLRASPQAQKQQELHAVDSDDDDDSAEPIAEVAAAPKRRGRPPKAAQAGQVAAAPKRRGRPPKAAPAVQVAAAPKRRGRPLQRVEGHANGHAANGHAANGHAANGHAGGFALSLGAHQLVAEGASVELIAGGGLRLKFEGGQIELHGGQA